MTRAGSILPRTPTGAIASCGATGRDARWRSSSRPTTARRRAQRSRVHFVRDVADAEYQIGLLSARHVEPHCIVGSLHAQRACERRIHAYVTWGDGNLVGTDDPDIESRAVVGL